MDHEVDSLLTPSLPASAHHPVLLSTSRNINQGLTDVLDEQWDPATQTLSGKSRVISGDPYELRIAVPEGNWQIKEAATEGTPLLKKDHRKNGNPCDISPSKNRRGSLENRFLRRRDGEPLMGADDAELR